MPDTLLFAFAIGFVAASPIGPVGMLCLRRTLSRGAAAGLVSALGVAFAYSLWSYAAIHGVSALSGWIQQEEILLQTGIGLFFSLYGLHSLFHTPDICYPALTRQGGVAEFLSTFLVVLFNPATFLMFSALFAIFGIAANSLDPFESLETALSVSAGALFFWIVMAGLIHSVRDIMADSLYHSVHRTASQAILLFGVAILLFSLSGAPAPAMQQSGEYPGGAMTLRQ